MQRLVLAILIVAVLVAALALIGAGLRRSLADRNGADTAPAVPDAHDGGLPKLAFALLMALIAYVGIAGPF